MSAMTEAKAERLIAEGKVRPIDGEPRAFTVQGANGWYRVVIGAHMAWCSPLEGQPSYPHCRNGLCSHAIAGRRFLEQ